MFQETIYLISQCKNPVESLVRLTHVTEVFVQSVICPVHSAGHVLYTSELYRHTNLDFSSTSNGDPNGPVLTEKDTDIFAQ